jgi:hypothetical protein
MRTATKSFTIALVLATVLAVPAFAAREDPKRERRGGDQQQQQQTIIHRLINKIVHIFDDPIVTQPGR